MCAFCCHFNLQLLFRYAQLSLKLLLPECLLLLLSFSCHALLPPPVSLPFFLSISSFFCLCFAQSTSEILSLSCIKRAKMFFLTFFHYRTSRSETPESNLMPSNCGIKDRNFIADLLIPGFTATYQTHGVQIVLT